MKNWSNEAELVAKQREITNCDGKDPMSKDNLIAVLVGIIVVLAWVFIPMRTEEVKPPKKKKVDCTYSIQYQQGLVTYLGKGEVME